MKTILFVICFCAYAFAQPSGGGVFPPPTKPACTATRTTNCSVTADSAGAVSVGTTAPGAGGAFVMTNRGVPFSLHSADDTFDGQRDDLSIWAYNIQQGTVTTKRDAAEPWFRQMMESNVKTSSGDFANQHEWSMDWQSATSTALLTGTYTSGITATGTAGQTCLLTAFNGGGANATATVRLTGTNTIAGSAALIVTGPGTGYTAAPTSATAGNGTATCSGTATVATTVGPVYRRAMLMFLDRVTGDSQWWFGAKQFTIFKPSYPFPDATPLMQVNDNGTVSFNTNTANSVVTIKPSHAAYTNIQDWQNFAGGTAAAITLTAAGVGKLGINTSPSFTFEVYTPSTNATNESVIIRNGGSYHQSILFSSGSPYADTKAYGIYGGPNAYISGAIDSFALVMASAVPDFRIVKLAGNFAAPTTVTPLVIVDRATGSMTIGNLAGTGVQYVCADANGVLTRSATACGL